MQEEINKLQVEKQDLETEKAGQIKKKDKLDTELGQLRLDLANKQTDLKQLATVNDTVANQAEQLKSDSKELESKNALIMAAISETKAEKKAKEVAIKQVTKEINDKFQQFITAEKEARAVSG